MHALKKLARSFSVPDVDAVKLRLGESLNAAHARAVLVAMAKYRTCMRVS
jgi:hypothetical protein